MTTSTASTVPRVAFGLNPGDPFWVEVSESVHERAEQLGLALTPVSAPSSVAADEAGLRFLEDLKVLEVQALISHVLPDALMLAILGDGIPVVCAEDTTLIHPLLVSVHGLDQAAVLTAEFVAERLGGRGRVLIAGALTDRAQTAQRRTQGFRSVLTRYPGLDTLDVNTPWGYAEALEELAEEGACLLAWLGGGAADAVIGMSDSIALAARDAGRASGFAGSRTIVAGINGDPLAIAAIAAGTMHATVETSAQDLGFKMAEFALGAARREALPDHFPYSLELVSAANVSQVAARKLLAIARLPSRLVNVNRRLEEQRLVQMQTSLELNQRVGSILDQDELLVTLAEIIRVHYDYDRVRFYFWSDSDRMLVPAPDRAGGGESALSLHVSGPLGRALLNNQAIYIPDTLDSKRYASDPLWPEVRSRVALPVHVGGRVLGVLDLHSRRRTLRNQAELDGLQTLANELGTAMRNCQLYAQAVQARADAVQDGLAKSRLLAAASHQLQAPLDAILDHCAAACAAASGDLARSLRAIERNGGDARRMAADLLGLAQAETGVLPLHLEEIEPRSFVQEVFDTAAQTLAHGEALRWKLQVPAHLPLLVADPARLRAVLANLLDNAARFTERGQIVLGAEASETHLHLWVQDTGCGIAPEDLAQLRQGLVVGAGAANGLAATGPHLGLGLAIARQVVARHGGELQIESEWGRGATCHVRLPLDTPAVLAGRREPVVGSRAGASSRRPRLSEQLVEQIRAYVAENFANPFTREQLAAALSVSPAYVSRVFRQQTGMVLWDYVNSYRIARARDLLYHSDMSVTEVAFAVGFNDPAYFSRVFRQETGNSPHNHRSRA